MTSPPAPTSTLAPGETAAPTPTVGPDASAIATDQPTAPGASEIALVSPTVGGEPTPVPAIVDVAPAVAPATDFTPIVIAIVAAGLLIAFGIGAAGFALRGRRGPG